MAFDMNLLAKASTSGNTNAPSVYTYTSPEATIPAVFNPGYFNAIKNLLRAGDCIMILLPGLAGAFTATVNAVSPNVEIG